MIFLDANIFLRYLVSPTDDATSRMRSASEQLFLQIRDGLVEATTSEVVIHQVCFILRSNRSYRVPAEQVIDFMTHLLTLSGMRFQSGERRLLLRAFELWRSRPSLGFADSMIAARCEHHGWELATFDEQLGSLPSVTRWSPEPAS